jgi:large subunit ribosomal protein L21
MSVDFITAPYYLWATFLGVSMYSIIELNNKQYMVEAGKPALVDRLDLDENQDFTIDRVLYYRDDKEVKVGTPYIEGLVLNAKVLGMVKGKKIRVFKYKKRKDYRRTIGSRPQYSKILVK